MPCLARNPSFYDQDEDEGVSYKVQKSSDEEETDNDFFNEKDTDPLPTANEPFVNVEFGQWLEEFLQTEAAINASKLILNLQQGWDDESGIGYSVETWQRAASFVKTQLFLARDRPGVRFSAPMINPADGGTIDVYWQLPDRKLLINIPSEAESKATFYGEAATGETIGGKIDLAEPSPQFMLWLNRTR
jgi:hypothetical protein